MKKRVLLLYIFVFVLTGCNTKNQSKDTEVVVTTNETTTQQNILNTDILEQMNDFQQELIAYFDALDPDMEIADKNWLMETIAEISYINPQQSVENLSYHELRILKDLLYARRGMLLKNPDTYYHIMYTYEWYRKVLEALSYNDKIPTEYDQILLPEEEKKLIERIDSRIAILQKEQYQNINGLSMGNPSLIANLYQFDALEATFEKKLTEYNFVITPGKNIQLFHVYEENDYKALPSFITTDLFLQAFHMYFSYILKVLEQEEFIPALKTLCYEMHKQSIQITESDVSPEIKELAARTATFYAIPYYLLEGEKLALPAGQQSFFDEEINNIQNKKDNFSRFLNYTDVYFPYSLFTPRGHYTRKKELTNYFQAMIWLQVASFCREEQGELKQAVFSAFLLKQSKKGTNLYQKIYEPTVFLVGLPDNLSVQDITLYLEKENVETLTEALSDAKVREISLLLEEISKTRNVIRPQEELSCRDKINFMPQRYLIDNEILQTLVDTKANSNRPYPKGLDVFSVFGSETATSLLDNFYKEQDNWTEYPIKRQELKNKFNDFKDWNSSVYNMWLHSLLELQKVDKNYPVFMQTKGWDYKNLNSGLASWAELKHDMILYAEQPTAAECGGGDMWPEPQLKGYVEPNIHFWKRLQEMILQTERLLGKHGLMNEDIEGKTEQLKNYCQFLIKVTEKELKGTPLSEEEYTTIRYLGASIDYFTLSVIDPDNYARDWSFIQGPDKSIAVIADIYTRNVLDCQKNGILHVGTGNVDYIHVIVEIEGQLYLTRGAVFSYYEFTEPLDKRLTDKAWQKRLEENMAPSIQPWMERIRIKGDAKVNDKVFYSSGC